MKFRDYSFGSTILGEGLSCCVYKAKKEKSKNMFAIKCISQKFFQNQRNKQLLANEIQALKMFKHHQNIIQMVEHGKQQKNYYIVTELCQKGSLADHLENGKTLSQVQAVYIIKELIKAYKNLYNNHYIHRDIKPGNILINSKNQIRLADFGFAINTLKNDIHELQKSGTPFYMAPESLQHHVYTYKSDFWAIGVTFYRMLTGELPFKNASKHEFEGESIRRCLEHSALKQISFYAKQFLRLIFVKNPHQRMSAKDLFEFKFQKLNKSLHFPSRTLESLRIQSRNQFIATTTQSDFRPKNKSQIIPKKRVASKIEKKDSRDSSTFESSKQFNASEQQEKAKIKVQQKSNQKASFIVSKAQKQKKNITCCKIIDALLSQLDLIRFINRMIYRIQKYLHNQSQLIGILQKLILLKLSELNSLEQLSQNDKRFFLNDPSYGVWKQLIEQYRSKLCFESKEHKRVSIQEVSQKIIESLKKSYFEYSPKSTSNFNSQILITIDFLISLKLLIDMQTSCDYEDFYLKSSIGQILEAQFPKQIRQEHFDQITKKLINLNFF